MLSRHLLLTFSVSPDWPTYLPSGETEAHTVQGHDQVAVPLRSA